MAIAQQTVGTSATTIYTSTNESAVVSVYFMNNDASAVTLQIHVVQDGDTAADTNKIVKDLSISAADTYVMDTEKLILSNNDTIQASASTGSVIQATVSYIGVS